MSWRDRCAARRGPRVRGPAVGTYVRLRVGAEAYAVPVGEALEITELGDVAAVPGAPAGLLGVRNLRGRILPVIDLAVLLGAEPAEPAAWLLVTEAAGRRAGLAVGEVTGVGELAGGREDTDSPLLAGAVLTDGELVGIVDVAAVLKSLPGSER